MDEKIKLLNDTKRLLLFRYPRFGSEIASIGMSYRSDLRCHTAATDGRNIYFDPDFFLSIPVADRLFVMAHELMHIKFGHVFRLEDKNGNMRNLEVWNDATDAIINANLERDGFKIRAGFVNRPDALMYTAEEYYEMLLKEMQPEIELGNRGSAPGDPGESIDDDSQKESKGKKGQSKDDGNGEENNNEDSNKDIKGSGNSNSKESDNANRNGGSDHSLWEEAFERMKEELSKEAFDLDFDENNQFSENRKQRIATAIENLERMRSSFQPVPVAKFTATTNLGYVGKSEEEFDWKKLLKREIDKTETVWTQRRSIEENNYAYRLEDEDLEDEAETEVMIDVSGSVSLDLVKSFLRILKPLLKQSKLRVGCFNEKYWGMVEINSERDIDNFQIPSESRGRYAWTEDWDLAVRSFTKKREINKIVFTDGYPCPGTMPKSDLVNEKVLWLVYGNEDFNPCCGKVIQISPRQLRELTHCMTNEDTYTRTRKLF